MRDTGCLQQQKSYQNGNQGVKYKTEVRKYEIRSYCVAKGWVTGYEIRTKGHLKIDFKREISDTTESFIYGRKRKERA